MSLRPKSFVPAMGMEIGPVAVVGRGAGREPGVIGLVIIGAVGRSVGAITGRFVKPLVPALSPCGRAGGLEESVGSTEGPERDWSGEAGRLVARIGALVRDSADACALTEIPWMELSLAAG